MRPRCLYAATLADGSDFRCSLERGHAGLHTQCRVTVDANWEGVTWRLTTDDAPPTTSGNVFGVTVGAADDEWVDE